MNKRTLKILDGLSRNLPSMRYQAAVINCKMSGEDVLLSGTKEINGEEVELEKDYICRTPLIREVDHKKRMKKIYNQRGKIGLITYLKPYCEPSNFGKLQVFIMRSLT